MIIVTSRNKDTNTYKYYSVDNAINGIETAFINNTVIYYDFAVEFNFKKINLEMRQTKAIALKKL